MSIDVALRLFLFLVLIILTVFPSMPSRFWVLRVGDFFRIQSFLLSATLAVWSVVSFSVVQDPFWHVAFPLAGIALAVWHARFFWTFMPWYPKAVPDAKTKEGSFRLLVVNVEMDNDQKAGVMDVVSHADPDLLLCVEVDEAWCASMEDLSTGYAMQAWKPLDNAYGMALFSKYDWKDFTWLNRVQSDIPSARFMWQTPRGSVLVHAVHPRPPAPGEGLRSGPRDLELLLLAEELDGKKEPILVLGDFNDVPWSRTIRRFRRLGGLLDPRFGRRILSTFHSRFPIFRWPLDMAFVSSHFRFVEMKRHRLPGSDHFAFQIDLQGPVKPKSGMNASSEQGQADQEQDSATAAREELSELKQSASKED